MERDEKRLGNGRPAAVGSSGVQNAFMPAAIALATVAKAPYGPVGRTMASVDHAMNAVRLLVACETCNILLKSI